MKFIFSSLSILIGFSSLSQEWVVKRNSGNYSHQEIKASFDEYMSTTEYERGKGIKQFWRWDNFVSERLGTNRKSIPSDLIWNEFENVKNRYRLTSSERLGDWESIGPTNIVNAANGYAPGHGQVAYITVRPNNINEIYVGTPNGGAWRSLDGGQTWNCLTEGYPVSGVAVILLDENNPNTILLGTGDRVSSDCYGVGILKSTDNGATWQNSSLDWETQAAVNVTEMKRSLVNTNTIHCTTTNGYYRSLDNGDTWDQLNAGRFYDIQFSTTDQNTERVLISNACSVEYSDDNGYSWTIADGLPLSACLRTEMAVSKINDQNVFALVASSDQGVLEGIYKSTDGGLNFSLLYNDLNILGINNNGTSTTGQGWYDLDIELNPENEDEIYVAGINLWKSTDAGVSFVPETIWTFPNNLGYIHPDLHHLNMVNDSTIFIGTDGGLFVTRDTAGTFNDLSSGLSISQFYGIDVANYNETRIIGGTQDNGSIYIHDGVEEHVLGGDGMNARFHPVNENIMFVCFQFGGLRRSTNGGQSFGGSNLPTNESSAWTMPYFFDQNNPTHLYAGRENVYKTTNNADSWSNISDGMIGGAVINEMNIHPSNSSKLALSKTTKLYTTEDNGATWNNLGDITSENISGIAYDPNNPRLYVTFSGFNATEKVMYTEDDGTTWVNATKNLPNVPVSCIAFDNEANSGVYIGTDFGVWYTNSNLTNWIPFNDNLPVVSVTEIKVHPVSGKIYAGTFGRGIYKSSAFELGSLNPIADFEVVEEGICIDEPVSLVDYSLYAENLYWNAPGSNELESNENNPTFTYSTPGTYSITLTANNASGSNEVVKNAIIYVYENSIQTESFTETFENVNSLEESKYYEITVSDNVHYEITDLAGANSSKSVKLNSTNAISNQDFELVGPNINLSHAAGGTSISFDYAFRSKNFESASRLILMGSVDCGETWALLKSHVGGILETGDDLIGEFIPNELEWKNSSRTLSTTYRVEDFQFKLVLENSGGNDLYIDNININYVAGIEEENNSISVGVYPNPTTDLISIELEDEELEMLQIVDITGKTLISSTTSEKINVNALAPGVYFINGSTKNDKSFAAKFVKE